jgi:sugar phosphate isomerase/epimerase
VGCHLIVFRGKDREDLDAVLRDVQAAGYDGIEGRVFFDGDAAQTNAKLGEYGLVQWSLSSGFGGLD